MKLKKLFSVLILISFISPVILSQDNAATERRRNTLMFGTETEIANLIQTLKNEKDDSLDNELKQLVETSKNKNILTGVFTFFSDAEKPGLEDRCVKIIEDRDTEAFETVQASVNYLGRVKAVQAVNVLKDLIDTGESRYLNAAIRALGRAASGGSKNDQDETASFLLDYFNEKNPGNEDQREIITAIGETGSSEAVTFLSDIIKNNDERTVLRMAALEAMSKIGDADGLDAIIMAVSASDPNVRSSAIAALGPYSGDAAEKAIIDGFRDSYYRTRIGASLAAGKRKMAAAIPYLRYRAENDEVPAVKDEAIRALGEIGSSEAMQVLETFFSERKNSDRVRILAGEMLLKNDAGSMASKVITELDDAKARSQTPLYNGFLRILGPCVSPAMADLAKRFFTSGTVIEKSYALDIAVNNQLKDLADEIRQLLDEKRVGASLARKAGTTLEKMGLNPNS